MRIVLVILVLYVVGCRRILNTSGPHAPRAEQDMLVLESCINTYAILTGSLPSSEDGLHALVTRPVSQPAEVKWERMLDEVMRDPWGNEYRYIRGNDFRDGYGLYSLGPDGLSSTHGNDPDDWNTWSESGRGCEPSLADHGLPVVGIALGTAIAGFALGVKLTRARPSPNKSE